MELNQQRNQINENVQQPTEAPIMKKFSTKPLAKVNTYLVLGTLAMIMAGVVTGYLLSDYSFAESGKSEVSEVSRGVEVSKTEAGLEDESNLPDTAEGILIEGGIEGEGTYHLDRGVGEDKYVYLTSTVIDLQSFTDKKVKVWGETISGLHAGWLMDVGKIKVIE